MMSAGVSIVEDRHGVNAGERRQQLGALELGVDRPGRALVPADGRVRIEPDDQQVAVATRRLKVAKMARVQDVENAVGEDDAAARGARVADERLERGGIKNAVHSGP